MGTFGSGYWRSMSTSTLSVTAATLGGIHAGQPPRFRKPELKMKFITSTLYYQHASNGIAENLIRLGKSGTRKLLFGSKLEANYWPYAMRMASVPSAVPTCRPTASIQGVKIGLSLMTSVDVAT
eukprot:2602324-Amphidinium_carterae.2